MNKKEKRLQKIHLLMQEHKRMRITDLAQMLSVTTETLRHDLDPLCKAGALEKEHGYVRLVQSMQEPPLSWRENENLQDKRKAAFAALSCIQDGQVVYIDAGTTLIQGLGALKGKKDITIATNSLPVAEKLCGMDIHTIMVGGFLYNKGRRCHGAFACNLVDGIQFDAAYMGTDGFQDAAGFTTVSENELTLKRHVIQQSRQIHIVTDKGKFHFRSPYTFCRFQEADTLFTNQLNETERQRVANVKKVVES